MPIFICWPSSLAGPVNGAEMPKRISLSLTPRMAGAASTALRTGEIDGTSSVGCGAVDAVATGTAGAVRCSAGAGCSGSVGPLATTFGAEEFASEVELPALLHSND